MSGDMIDQGADVLGSTQDSRGVVLLQTGDAVSPEVIGDRAELWQQAGFCSRPAKAVPGKSACQAIALKGGANDQVIATRGKVFSCGHPRRQQPCSHE